ncbi:hypothetical protein [Lentibacillus sp. Marseille-P4043]|uniref:hypothetical protein n=1 Tax=Lentibacillus sp. Marseille-P4043 TaxID=2040293 RepID=UPI000D0BA2D8|nr:hypothetical protein [Lentibacillus sp. Marseille-P4043]
MKIRYTEELLKDVIQQQIFPDAPEEISAFSLDHLVIGYLKKANGEKSHVSCVLDVDKHGILAILMDGFRADKAKGYQHFKFADMQGIKIKKGMLNYFITLQFTDGANYVFQVTKRSMKHLPNQNRNMEYITSVLNEQNLHEMKSTIYKKKVMENKIISSIYIVTLILFEIIAVNLSLDYAPNNIFLMIIIVISAAIIHFILCMIAALFLDMQKDKHFAKEYNQIIKAYQETNNAEVFLNELTSMKNPPKEIQSANAYYFSMSTALYKNNRIEEALSYLDEIQTTDRDLQKTVEEQRKWMKDEEISNIHK